MLLEFLPALRALARWETLKTSVLQIQPSATAPRRKPCEGDFETIKLISNGAYGSVGKFLTFVSLCKRLQSPPHPSPAVLHGQSW